MNIKLFFLVAAVSLSSSSTFAGQVYKWTDESGQVHYSDKQPNNVDSTRLKVSGGKQTSTRVSVAEKSTALEEQKQKDLERKAEELKANTQKKEQNARCQAIQENLTKIEQNARVRIEENGELRYLTPEELEQRKSDYRDQLDKFCK